MADTIRVPGKGDDDAPRRPPRAEHPPRAGSQPPRDAATSRGDGGSSGGTMGTPGTTPSSRPRRRSKDDSLILESLTGMYGMVGAGVAGAGQIQGNAGLVAAGVNITIQGEELAEQWLTLGEQVPAVRRALENMLKGGAVSVVIMGNVGIALPVLAAAGVIPQQVGNMFLHGEAVAAGQAFQAMQNASNGDGGTSG